MDITHLYIEPTSHCNLRCEMCSRNHWKNESIGHMDIEIFDKIMREIPDSVERIFFGGIGEPLTHPDIIYMIRQAKATGRRVEMITNGTMLTKERSKALVGAEIDLVWVSVDSLDEAAYAAIRKGGDFGSVMQNIYNYNESRGKLTGDFESYSDATVPHSRLGIAFVLMKKNLDSFRRLLERAEYFGIDEIKATHLIPYDAASEEQVCYRRMFDIGMFREQTVIHPNVDLPLMEPGDLKSKDMLPLLANPNMTFSMIGSPLMRRKRYCRFVSEGYVFVRWDGAVSPCMALLHDNQVYQSGRIRSIRHSGYGNIKEKSLQNLWNGPEYSAFRDRVENFTFSPCVSCASCDLFGDNETDCTGNPFPTCGGCLWAEGLFQCP